MKWHWSLHLTAPYFSRWNDYLLLETANTADCDNHCHQSAVRARMLFWMAQDIKKAEKVCSDFIATFWVFLCYRGENNSSDLEENACNSARRESILRFCSDKMIARGWNMLKITVSLLENDRPCFCVELWTASRRLCTLCAGHNGSTLGLIVRGLTISIARSPWHFHLKILYRRLKYKQTKHAKIP